MKNIIKLNIQEMPHISGGGFLGTFGEAAIIVIGGIAALAIAGGYVAAGIFATIYIIKKCRKRAPTLPT